MIATSSMSLALSCDGTKLDNIFKFREKFALNKNGNSKTKSRNLKIWGMSIPSHNTTSSLPSSSYGGGNYDIKLISLPHSSVNK